MAPFRWIDRLLQRRYDRVYNALMEHGVPKKNIRYGLWCLFMAFFFLQQTPWLASGDFGRVLVAVCLCALYIWVYGRNVAMDRRHDEEAERRGTISWSDAPFQGFALKLMACVLALAPGLRVAIWLAGTERLEFLRDHCQLLNAFTALSLGYLCGTPPKPKKPKEARELAPWLRFAR